MSAYPESPVESPRSPPAVSLEAFGSTERVPSVLPEPLMLGNDDDEYPEDLREWLLENAESKWTVKERHFLERVRDDCGDLLKAVPVRYRDAYGDRRLLRFLRQHKTCDKGLTAARKYLEWRRDHGVDKIREALGTDEFGPRDWPHGDQLLDRFCILPCSTNLFDVKGNALCVEQYGHWPADRLRDITAEKYLQWQLHCLEHKSMQLEKIAMARERTVLEAARRNFRRLDEGWGEIARLCTIFDMTGLTFAHALLPIGFKMVKHLIPMVQKYYPWLQDTTLVVNASSTVYTFWHTLKPILPKHTQRKIFIYSSTSPSVQEKKSGLATNVRLEFLPTVLGGLAPCPALTPPLSADEYALKQQQQPQRTFTSGSSSKFSSFASSASSISEADSLWEEVPRAWSSSGESSPGDSLRRPSSPDSVVSPRSPPLTPGEASPPDSPYTDVGDLSPTGRVLTDHLAAGGKTLVFKHSRRRSIKSRRYLTCTDGLLKLTRVRRPSGLWRRASSRMIHLHLGICVVQGQQPSPDGGDPWQHKIYKRAATLPPNFLVVGTRSANNLVLEFETDEEANVVAAQILAAANDTPATTS